jgi:hypothetical protein
VKTVISFYGYYIRHGPLSVVYMIYLAPVAVKASFLSRQSGKKLDAFFALKPFVHRTTPRHPYNVDLLLSSPNFSIILILMS